MTLVDRLQAFRTALLQKPSADETYELWTDLEPELSLAQQSRVLEAWNKYLSRRTTGDNVREVFVQVTRECRQPSSW